MILIYRGEYTILNEFLFILFSYPNMIELSMIRYDRIPSMRLIL